MLWTAKDPVFFDLPSVFAGVLIPLVVVTFAFAMEFLVLLPSASSFLRFTPVPGPLLRFVEDVFA